VRGEHQKVPAKLVVVPGAVLGQLKVHLLGEDGEPKLVRVQLQLQVAPYGKENRGVEGQHCWLVVQRQLHLLLVARFAEIFYSVMLVFGHLFHSIDNRREEAEEEKQ